MVKSLLLAAVLVFSSFTDATSLASYALSASKEVRLSLLLLLIRLESLLLLLLLLLS